MTHTNTNTDTHGGIPAGSKFTHVVNTKHPISNGRSKCDGEIRCVGGCITKTAETWSNFLEFDSAAKADVF